MCFGLKPGELLQGEKGRKGAYGLLRGLKAELEFWLLSALRSIWVIGVIFDRRRSKRGFFDVLVFLWVEKIFGFFEVVLALGRIL